MPPQHGLWPTTLYLARALASHDKKYCSLINYERKTLLNSQQIRQISSNEQMSPCSACLFAPVNMFLSSESFHIQLHTVVDTCYTRRLLYTKPREEGKNKSTQSGFPLKTPKANILPHKDLTYQNCLDYVLVGVVFKVVLSFLVKFFFFVNT